jgi:putative hydrolase of the HAD superfamily
VPAFLFDLDGTLYNRDTAVRGLVAAQWERFQERLKCISADGYVQRVLSFDAHGMGDKSLGFRELAQDFQLTPDFGDELLRHFWKNYHAYIRPDPALRKTLESLRARGYTLGIISNGPLELQTGTLAALEIASLFSVVLISGAEGCRKPDATIFKRACDRIGLPVDECTFVGDHPQTDIDGAIAAGLRAIWKRTSHWGKPAHDVPVIDNLDEVLLHA